MRKVTYIALPIIVVFLLMIPTLLSIPPLKQVLIAKFEAKMKAKITVDTISLSWLGPQKFKGMAFSTNDLNGSVDQIILNKPFWGLKSLPYSLAITNGRVKVLSIGTSIEQINATIQGQNVQASGVTAGGRGNFSIQGTASDNENYDLTLQASEMPSLPIDWLLEAKGMLAEMLGPTFNVRGYANAKNDVGALGINLSSDNARIFAEPSYDKKTVTLIKPLYVQAKIPKNFTTAYLKKPVIFWDPVTLKISNEGFSMPRKFSLKNLYIGAGNINLGRLTLYKQEVPQALSTWLKAPNLSQGQVDAWLTCTNFSLNGGLLHVSRIDALLAKQIHLSAWGSADLLKETLDGVLGIPASVLTSTFGLSQLSSDYILQVPVTGTFSNPQVDTTAGAAKIATLIASQTAQKAGGQFGQIIGTVANTATQGTQPQTPPPCQTPFPWGNN